MNLVSLCSGYGGLDLAVEAAFGAETVAFSEVEPAPAQVFARHWPDARPLGDLTAVDWTTVDADVVCAGFPCQDLSYAGKGAGITKDSRSGLWYAIEHALGVLRPGLVVLENVSAIVARRPGLDVVLAGLAALGFDAQWTCVRASDVGAPHRRERWFLVAWNPNGERLRTRGGRVRGPSSADEGAPREWERRGDATVGTGEDAPHAPLIGRPEGWTEPDGGRATAGREGATANADITGGEAWNGRQGPGDAGRSQPLVGSDSASADPDLAGLEGRGREGDRRPDERAVGPDGVTAWGDYGPAIDRWERTVGRPTPAPTDDRGRLSPLFVEWMMGLPAGWVTDTDGLSRSHQLKCLGNGVVPQQAHHALSMLLERDVSEVAA